MTDTYPTQSSKATRVRLDDLLVSRGLAPSKATAISLIIQGKIFSGFAKLDKPGLKVRSDLALTQHDNDDYRYPSRAAYKLLHAIQHSGLDLVDFTALDIGCAHGGFTQVLLEAGVARVFAVDVGYGQMDQRLRQDQRVVLLERTNAKHLTASQITQALDLIVCDASFIGLGLVLPPAFQFVREGGCLFALIKPQFEARRNQIKDGIVVCPSAHQEVCDKIRAMLDRYGWHTEFIIPSPIKGTKGNQEFIIHARKVAYACKEVGNVATSQAI